MKVALEPYELEDWELTQRRLGRREFADAEFFLRHRIGRHGLRPTYAALLARVLKRVGKYNAALSILDESLAQHPNSMRLHAEKGDTHFARMEYALSADDYAKALSVDEEDCTNPNAKEFVQDNLAMSRYFLGDAAGAAELIRPLLVIHPEQIRYRKHYTQALAKSADEDVALSDLPNIDVLHAPELGALLCWRLLDEKRFYDALRCSEQLTAKYPGNPQSIRCHADVLWRLSRFDEAIDVLESAIRNQYVDAPLYILLAQNYQTTGQIQSARSTYMAGFFRFPENLSFLVNLFSLDWLFGRKNECVEYCKKILTFPGWHRFVHSIFDLHNIVGCSSKNNGVFPETEEGKRLASRFACIAQRSTSWLEDHDPSKVVLSKTQSTDLQKADVGGGIIFRENALMDMSIQSARHAISSDGYKIVTNQPSDYAYTVFLAGYCQTVRGFCDSTTLGSALQDVFNSRAREKVRIVNYGGRGVIVGCAENVWLRLLHSKELLPGDKVLYYELSPSIFPNNDAFYNNRLYNYMSLQNDLARKGVGLYLGFTPSLVRDSFRTLGDDNLYEASCEFGKASTRKDAEDSITVVSNRLTDNGIIFSFFDDVLQYKTPNSARSFWWDHIHYSMALNWPLAEAMYDFLSLPPKMQQTRNLPSFKKKCMDFLQKTAFDEFVCNENIRSWIAETYDAEISNHKNVGAIVMNCNPFTLGHRYLVEKALESAEVLYLFIVEEDLSQFSFADRLMLVKEGVRDFGGRVKVVPSGKFIISSFSFAEYFTKAVEITPPDSTTDVLIFASMIAPALNIRTRFVGEEPACMVTRSYNERMLQLLPDMGCAVNVIPRKEVGGVAISASRVRKALEENDLESIKNLVPDTTYNYLAKGTQHNTDYRTPT